MQHDVRISNGKSSVTRHRHRHRHCYLLLFSDSKNCGSQWLLDIEFFENDFLSKKKRLGSEGR